MTDLLKNWLLGDDNPSVKFRTQTEILNQPGDKAAAASWVFDSLPEGWHEQRGLWYRYYIAALAECVLNNDDIPMAKLDRAFAGLDSSFEWGCGDFMLQTSLVKLFLSEHEIIVKIIDSLKEHSLPDGGFLCLHRLNKLKYTPKSCYKANLHALLFLAECKKSSVDISPLTPLVDYFLNRGIFYRSDDRASLVLNSREGWRTIDIFYPFEVMRVGLQNVLEALCALGYGDDDRLSQAWTLLDGCKDADGRVMLGGTLTKSYLPKERVGRSSKWATFYVMLAEKHRSRI
ncbi:MAG: hypothetical protein ACOX8S_09730 [Christensenellales bacterium]